MVGTIAGATVPTGRTRRWPITWSHAS
jgi:hypothetical protein